MVKISKKKKKTNVRNTKLALFAYVFLLSEKSSN